MVEPSIFRISSSPVREPPDANNKSADKRGDRVIRGVLDEVNHTKNVDKALRLLFEASTSAAALGVSRWEFAVDIFDLRTVHIRANSLRYLICAGFVAHAHEIASHAEKDRQFRFTNSLTFTDSSCFTLTTAGDAVAQLACMAGKKQAPNQLPQIAAIDTPRLPVESTPPQWDHERHELRIGSLIVKRFKSQALNQEIILMAFEEENWPPRIDDPLRQVPELDPRRRLHDTIKCLNRHQVHHLLRFRGDGSGEGVIWEYVRPK